jgi:uncharacterized protein YjbI with pentapeptide repeats
MMDQTGIKRPTCNEDGCIGVSLGATPKCLGHASDEQRHATLKQLGETGEIDARGVPITQALLEQILAAAPRDVEHHPTFTAAHFEWATFQGPAEFELVTFRGLAEFEGATFQGDAGFLGAIFQVDAGFHKATFQGSSKFEWATFQGPGRFHEATFRGDAGFAQATFQTHAVFSGATFQGDAGFIGVTFRGLADFMDATFEGAVSFGDVIFRGLAEFRNATFKDDAKFGGVIFRGLAEFRNATFKDDARFAGATFQGDARFHQATFQGDAGFAGVTFRRDAGFGGTRLEQARQLGPLLVCGVLRLDAAHFEELIQIETSTRGLSCQRARFPAGVQFRLRGAQIVLDDADLSGPSILVGIAALSDAQLAKREQRLIQAILRLAPQAAVDLSAGPRLLSVQGANVAGLTVSNVDLAECRFAGAHNLDRLRLEARVTFSPAPVRLPWDWRQVIAEERAWRAQQSERWTPRWRAARSARWATPQRWPAWLHQPYGTEWPGVLPAGQTAGLYRALRKGREDAKDEPDAADFYYGEMEMRRLAGRPTNTSTDHLTGKVSRGQVEHAILTVYWLISGYGLRAWRALAWLAALTAGFAVAFHLAGFTRPPQPVSYWTSLLYAFRATLSLTDSEVGLTAWGKLLQGLLRLTGPVLLGLTLLAIRARTKR